MQVIDIRITPASDARSMSRVCFVGEGGDEVAVTIADRHEGGSTVEQELVAKAKVMLLHAAAAQVRDVPAGETETGFPDAEAEADGAPQIFGDAQDDPIPHTDEASPGDEVEEHAGAREGRKEGPERRSGFGIDPLG